MDDGAQIEPADWDLAAQPVPDFEVDQRVKQRQLVTGQSGDFESLRDVSARGVRRAAHITRLNAKPWW